MSFSDILKGLEARREGKAASKMPSWAAAPGLEYPTDLCLEQCSSEAAARYKAGIVSQRSGTAAAPSESAAAPGAPATDPGETGAALRVADLTGGLGVDSWAFAKAGSAVFYNEMNQELRAAAERNFARLGVLAEPGGEAGIRCNGFTISAESIDWADALRAFRPDWIYIDPARRDAAGKKVFLLEDCSPDVLTLMPTLTAICSRILLKLSPMADITMVATRLGHRLQEVHIVSLGGEVKELLCIIGEAAAEEPLVRVVSAENPGASFSFRRSEEAAAPMQLCSQIDRYILEPSTGMLKSGAFKLASEGFSLRQISAATHLYTADAPTEPGPLFKCFELIETLPFGKAGFAAVKARYPHADVTSRGLPLSSDELRVRLGIKPGPSGGIHVFGVLGPEGKTILVTKTL